MCTFAKDKYAYISFTVLLSQSLIKLSTYVLCYCLQIVNIFIDQSFTQHGGDSLTALQFTAVVKELFGVTLNVDTLLSSNMSLNQLSDMINSHSNIVTDKETTLDLMKSDMNLELPKFSGSRPPSGNSNKSIFLTGLFLCRCISILFVCS